MAAEVLNILAKVKTEIDKSLASKEWNESDQLGYVIFDHYDTPVYDQEVKGLTITCRTFNQAKYDRLLDMLL